MDVWDGFLAAIGAGDDEATERAASLLDARHEHALIVLAAEPGEGRWWAVRTLARTGSIASMPALLHALDDADPSTRAAAALAIGHLVQREPDAATALEKVAQHFTDADGFVRQQAVDGMALAGEAAMPVLATALSPQNDPVMRVRATAALRLMRQPYTARLLFPLLNDSNHLVHTLAYEALDDLGMLDNLLLSQ